MPVLLVLRFLAELAMLAAYAVGGWVLGRDVGEGAPGLALGLLLGLLLPALAAAVWGRWVAPKARHRLRDPGRLGVEVTLFAGALVTAGRADVQPEIMVALLAMWAAFLVSMPARRVQL